MSSPLTPPIRKLPTPPLAAAFSREPATGEQALPEEYFLALGQESPDDEPLDQAPRASSPTSRPMEELGLNALMDGRKPGRTIKSERPWHRTAAYLSARGLSREDIANAVDVSPAMITLLSKQTWFRELVAKIIHSFDLSGTAAQDLLRASAASAALVQVELCTTGKSESVRLAASTAILDRVFGKAVQTVQQSHQNAKVAPEKEIEDLRKKLESTLAQNPELGALLTGVNAENTKQESP